MLKNLAEGDTIQTQLGPAVICKIGPTSRGERSMHYWAMLTLDIDGKAAYCVAREDELAQEK